MHLEEVVGHADEQSLPLQDVDVPEPQGEGEGHPVQEALQEPLNGVDARQDLIPLLQPAMEASTCHVQEQCYYH